jgi:hypothetical protein
MKTLSSAFTVANRTALLGWVILAAYPLISQAFTQAAQFVLALVVMLLCAAYSYFIFLGKRHDLPGMSPKGGFFTLEGVMRLFKSPRVVLAGWIHYLAFDLMVGLYIVTDAASRGISHLWLLPALCLTLLFGPAGLLLYLGLRAVLGAGAASVML